AADYVFIGNNKIDFEIPGTLRSICKGERDGEKSFSIFSTEEYLNKNISNSLCFAHLSLEEITDDLIDRLKEDKTAVIVLSTENFNGMMEQRRVFFELL